VLAVVGVTGILYYVFKSVDVLQTLVDAVPKRIGKRLGIIVSVVVLLPIWWTLQKRSKPPLFEMEISTEGVEYKFRDAEYANDFEEVTAKAKRPSVK
jgi:hypothetical protein